MIQPVNNHSTHNKGCRTYLRRILGGALALILILPVAGMSYQALATARDLRAYPPPGKLYDVGDHRLHINCLGIGSPTVILEAGLGDGALNWHLVQVEASQTTRVCAYDRAGVGWSEGVTEPLSSTDIAGDLRTLLAMAHIEPPYVLVGHSSGGLHVRSFTQLYPDEVVGLVLVDSSHEQQTPRQNAIAGQETPSQETILSLMALTPTLARLGILRLLGGGEMAAAEAPFPAETKAALAATRSRTAQTVASYQETKAVLLDTSQPNPPASLGDLPVIVITRGIGDAEEMGDLITSEASADYWQARDELWIMMQTELANLSTNSQHWVAEESGHYIPYDQPVLIVDAIRQLTLRLMLQEQADE